MNKIATLMPATTVEGKFATEGHTLKAYQKQPG